VAQESDGYPEAWFLPDARNIPAGYATTGTFYDQFKTSSSLGSLWTPGSAVFQYPNRQRATTLWYHDHTLGMTRANVYAGPAGFYLLRGGDDDAVADQLPGPAPARGDQPGTRYYEIPLVIQDRSFNVDGSLFYPDSREFFDGFTGPFIPGSDMAPIWNPEVFANTMVVNGRTWPYLNVERRRYRFRLLNACNSRFLILKHSNNLPLWQIGADGGFLPAPVEQSQLLMAPAERADVIVDFSRLAVGTRICLLNIGPDEPFGGGVPGADFPMADPETTGQVLELRVVAATSTDRSTPPHRLRLPDLRGLGRADSSRQVSLNEEDSAELPGVGPLAAKLGTVDAGGMGMPMMWADAPTETPTVGSTEIWEIFNYTEDAHPVHPHTVQVQIINRQPFDPATGLPSGPRRPPEAGETGFKDTIIAYPGEITRIKARFDSRGLFVWHCHILEHEDNEMMRPLVVSG
jgi:bilirubin oxidase